MKNEEGSVVYKGREFKVIYEPDTGLPYYINKSGDLISIGEKRQVNSLEKAKEHVLIFLESMGPSED